MKLFRHISFLSCVAVISALSSCDDDNTSIGSVITSNEVVITNDTLTNQILAGKAIYIDSFNSKTGNLMIGKIQNEKYGNLSCSFVTQLMCATNLQIPDSLFSMPDFINRVDSCKLILGAERTDITGDSLAPQLLTVYKLTKMLPSDINNNFDPAGYYDPSTPFASRSYTLSEIASRDSVFYNNSYIDISVDLPVEFGKSVIREYQTNPGIFQWPQTMAKDFLPGFYIENSFGNGCVANISSVYLGIFYHILTEKETTNDAGNKETTVVHENSIAIPFTVSPEVLSSNNISYMPSEYVTQKNNDDTDGEVVLTTPGGYIAQVIIPGRQLVESYLSRNKNLSTVNELVLQIPAESFDNEAGIGVAQNVLLVKSSEYEEFFAKNKIPDNLTSFTGVYNASSKKYLFSSMREYFLNLLSQDTISDDDLTFTIVPVEIGTETSSNYYGSGTTYVTKCVPYTAKPTLTLLKTNEATLIFSFSTQIID